MNRVSDHLPRSASRTAYWSVSLVNLGLATLALMVAIMPGTGCGVARLSEPRQLDPEAAWLIEDYRRPVVHLTQDECEALARAEHWRRWWRLQVMGCPESPIQ